MKLKTRLSSSKSLNLKTAQDKPQQKPFKILNLSELLDHQVTPPSERIMRNRLSSQRSSRNQEKLIFEDQAQNTVKSSTRAPLKINYQHLRSKSSSTIKNYYESIKSPFQKRGELIKKEESKFNPLLIKSKSVILSPEVKGVSLGNCFKSQQLISKNSIKIQNCAFRQEIYASSKSKSSEAMLIMSLEYRNSHGQDPRYQYQTQQKAKNKIKFLKKGSSLQKQIVINLLKNKLIKEHEQNKKKQYTEYDILSMVKLYKGFLGFPKTKCEIKNPQLLQKQQIDKNSKQKFKKQNSTSKDSEFLRTYQSLPERIAGKHPKPIVGWQTSPDFQLQELKNDHHTEITMDHSYGLS